MLRISNVKLSINKEINLSTLKAKVSRLLRVSSNEIKSLKISKESIDARDKNNICYVFCLDFEIKNEDKYIQKNVTKIKEEVYTFPKGNMSSRPVIVGFGPSGFMAGLCLAKAGLKPIIIERGKDVARREKDVNAFLNSGVFNPKSNIQFGSGGAGTFSDGKLTTGIKDKRIPFVLNEFVKYGANEEILYRTKVHIGTDNLRVMIKNIEKEIINYGGEIFFETTLIDITTKNNELKSVILKNNEKTYELETNKLLLCLGHSARDTLYNLEKHLIMIPKPFSVGVRIEHSQEMINKAMYGEFYDKLPPADYKLAVHLKNGRSCYTFCMCPGGYVVPSSSEENMVVTNGMSYYKRDGENANSALLIGITPDDFGNKPLDGIEYQRSLERKAFELGGGGYCAPAQLVGDFLNNTKSTSFKSVMPTYKPRVLPSNLNQLFPEIISQSLKLGIMEMDRKIKGFANPHAVLTAIESRSSSPVRILRDNTFNSNIRGVLPCGEGAGYAGGIMSSAVDGIKCAESLINT